MSATPEELKALEEERGKVYGDPQTSHANIGLEWTGLIQQHYGVVFSHPIPDYLVAQMMVVFKMSRSVRVFKQDNYDDGHVYMNFAEEFQRNSQAVAAVAPLLNQLESLRNKTKQ